MRAKRPARQLARIDRQQVEQALVLRASRIPRGTRLMLVSEIRNGKVLFTTELLYLCLFLVIDGFLAFIHPLIWHEHDTRGSGLEHKMSTITVFENGGSASLSSGNYGSNNVAGRGGRKANKGWTRAAARGVEKFLQSVDPKSIAGRPYAVSLTVQAKLVDNKAVNIPSPEMFHCWISALFKGCMRPSNGKNGATLQAYIWVLEWQKNGEPHLHCVCWWPEHMLSRDVRSRMVGRWCILLAKDGYCMGNVGSTVKQMRNIGWFQYLSKHGARGVKSYQRAKASMPMNWIRKPGAMWGHSSKFPVAPIYKFDVDYFDGSEEDGESRVRGSGFHTYRRLVCKWVLAKLRSNRPMTSNFAMMARWKKDMYSWRHRRCCGLGQYRPGDVKQADWQEWLSDSRKGMKADPWGVSHSSLDDSIRRYGASDLMRTGYLVSSRRGMSEWMPFEAQRQILQYIADNQKQIGCRVVQIVKDASEQSILAGVPTVKQAAR